ncbi:MAG TPA: molybdenum ABC transporter ATP-binding protein [Roseiarcus sp.]|nr:molybdenum ABC transporter ATP-binding protein [Roseiarcus sp.]
MIEIQARCQLGAFSVDVALKSRGPTLALFGPSGAGKTTVLNIVAGLTRPDEGRIVVDGVTFLDTAAGVDLAPRQRRVGYVFQELRLFPHLRVEANLLYGRRWARHAKPVVDFDQAVELLGLRGLLTRRPTGLSGGEKQRVAIGRALLADPRVLLMDEPLAALDEARRAEILAYIEKLRAAFAIPVVFVSHRLSEVERMADDIAILENGRIVATQSTPAPLTKGRGASSG